MWIHFRIWSFIILCREIFGFNLPKLNGKFSTRSQIQDRPPNFRLSMASQNLTDLMKEKLLRNAKELRESAEKLQESLSPMNSNSTADSLINSPYSNFVSTYGLKNKSIERTMNVSTTSKPINITSSSERPALVEARKVASKVSSLDKDVAEFRDSLLAAVGDMFTGRENDNAAASAIPPPTEIDGQMKQFNLDSRSASKSNSMDAIDFITAPQTDLNPFLYPSLQYESMSLAGDEIISIRDILRYHTTRRNWMGVKAILDFFLVNILPYEDRYDPYFKFATILEVRNHSVTCSSSTHLLFSMLT